MNKIKSRVKNKFFWWLSEIKWGILLSRSINCFENNTDDQYFTIGITTFKDRFNPYFKPLIKKLNYLFPHNQIIVVVNGHLNQQEQNKYLNKIKSFFDKYKNITAFYHQDPIGLSNMWNIIIQNSKNNKILMLNDDLNIKPEFRKELIESNILETNIGVINYTWGNYIISKNIVKQVGWFDERLTEIGGEDDDYSARIAIGGIEIGHQRITSIKNSSKKYKRNSYGHDMTGEYRYSRKNTEFLKAKWAVSDKPLDGYTFVPNRKHKYWKLKEELTTPDFYPQTNNV
jgi:hypothetical protein